MIIAIFAILNILGFLWIQDDIRKRTNRMMKMFIALEHNIRNDFKEPLTEEKDINLW